MKSSGLLLMFVLVISFSASGQTVEINGNAKVMTMSPSTTASGNVVRLADGTLAERKYQIGDWAQGGIVFWVDETGEHGLACAKTDQAVNMRWFAGSLIVTQAKGDGMFAGEMNTAICIASHAGAGDDGAIYAARLCAELSVTENGFTYGDWYLPSKEELNKMQQNRATIEATATAHGGTIFGAFLSYWSSTEISNGTAWSQNITLGTQSSTTKSSNISVRAIRAF